MDGKPDLYMSLYAPGSSFFFKIKFNEPYMMYCEARDYKVAVIEGQEGESFEE
jgi:tRNA splicing ligase